MSDDTITTLAILASGLIPFTLLGGRALLAITTSCRGPSGSERRLASCSATSRSVEGGGSGLVERPRAAAAGKTRRRRQGRATELQRDRYCESEG